MSACPGKSIAFGYYTAAVFHCDGCAERERLQRKLAVLDGEVVAYGADGCLTGDCPHEEDK